ncbi:hypothetical protein EV207_13434 [Scopulibacillus darangshiensis]|uniref:Uncharacterized protein n=1 Tax=Scopulibacillus darangshiensis TaxID=442528 RepID=A0A4R2NMG2_9BACL|nr:hypothetical protein EV207_13434 [Scopulibacillus darangshiensis]
MVETKNQNEVRIGIDFNQFNFQMRGLTPPSLDGISF